jgi:hypothetical protein
LRFWTQPGLYVYTTVGNLLLFRFCWAVGIFVWSRYDVNYISVFQFSDIKPNLLLVINQTATQFVLYCINLMIFFRANVNGSGIANTFLAYGCPSILIIMCVVYEYYEYRNFYNERLSRGIFTKQVVWDCVTAPFSKVTFRDVYAADTMTSFTKVISDFVYASCWIVSGAFMTRGQLNTDFGSDYLSCNNDDMTLFIVLLQLYPQFIRIMQCSRNYSKTRLTVHLYNILKYLTTVAVIVYGLFYHTSNAVYLALIMVSTLYKWYWDVVMDWGLFDVAPTWKGGIAQFACCCPGFISRIFAASAGGSRESNAIRPTISSVNSSTSSGSSSRSTQPNTPNTPYSNNQLNGNATPNSSSSRSSLDGSQNDNAHPTRSQPASAVFLRQHLMYPSYGTYYVCIVLDLVLRFLWVVSLLPPGFFGDFVGPQLNFCLASLEIVRRAMWGIFRLEYEHLKFVKKGTVGFNEQRRPSRVADMSTIYEYDNEEDNLDDVKSFKSLSKPGGVRKSSSSGGLNGMNGVGVGEVDGDLEMLMDLDLFGGVDRNVGSSSSGGEVATVDTHHHDDLVREFPYLDGVGGGAGESKCQF